MIRGIFKTWLKSSVHIFWIHVQCIISRNIKFSTVTMCQHGSNRQQYIVWIHVKWSIRFPCELADLWFQLWIDIFWMGSSSRTCLIPLPCARWNALCPCINAFRMRKPERNSFGPLNTECKNLRKATDVQKRSNDSII